jgi:uncharacterized protein
MTNRILIDKNIPVPMRDGIRLYADLYRPDTDQLLPAIVMRLPYNKNGLGIQTLLLDASRAAQAGFAVLIQDMRGRFASEGDFYPFFNEGRDGYDTVEWTATQPWCSGAVGMTGASYFGASQWQTAVEQPPHLKAIFPYIAPSEFYEGFFYQGGAFQLGVSLHWGSGVGAENARRLAAQGMAEPDAMRRLILNLDEITNHYHYLPLSQLSYLRESKAADFYFDWISHSTNDEYWKTIAANRHYDRIQVPAFNVGGWYDIFVHGTLENFVRMRQEGGSTVARKGQRLLIGPWAHAAASGFYADVRFGALSSADAADLTGLQIEYFSHYLKGENPEYDQKPPVRIYIMGENCWRDEQEWPLQRTQYTPWYLHSDGNAVSNGGTLSPEMPGQEERDSYLYDPRDPMPTRGGATLLPGAHITANAGPRDQRPVEGRSDILIYTSAPLQQPLEVTGPLTVTLYAATTALDTDFVVRLCDVHPDGTSLLLAEGILRARSRNGYEQPSLVEPGQVYKFQINLVATSNLYLEGHCIRVAVTSSSFPRFDRNPNTGNALGQDGPEELQPALQSIFHDDSRPSHILLPIIPR